MNDVSFNIDHMDFIFKDSLKLEGKMNECSGGLSELAKLLEGEISSFRSCGQATLNEVDSYISRVRALISEVEGKKSSAESKKKNEISPPPPPSVPAKATPEEKQAIMAAYNKQCSQIDKMNAQIRADNSKIDAYAKKCDSTLAKLRDILSRITQVEALIRQEISRTAEKTKSALTAVNNECRLLPGISKVMKQFTSAFYDTLEAAKEIISMIPSEINPPAYADKLFEINNRHTYIPSGTAGKSFSQGKASQGTKSTPTPAPVENAEPLINEREEDSFFRRIEGLTRFKMSGANLHRLGGKAFISKMKSLGYRLKPLPDGRLTDDKGIMYWEKNND